MVKAFTLLLALLIGLSFSGMTFAKSLGTSSDQLTIQSPLGGDKDKEGEDKDKPKSSDDKKDDKDKDKK